MDRAGASEEVPEEQAESQRERLDGVRARRDAKAVARTLAEVGRAAREGTNVMPAVIDAVEEYATVGEVTTVLKEVLGTYREPIRF